MNREEKRAYLNGYLDLKREIDCLAEENNFWKEKSYELSTPRLDKLGIRSSHHKEPLIEHLAICETIKAKSEEADKKMKEIMGLIDSIKNKDPHSEADQRSVLRYRYINGLYFHEIKNKMGFSLQNIYYLHRCGLDALDI